MNGLETRALTACYRSGSRASNDSIMQRANHSLEAEINGPHYVMAGIVNGVRADYRVRAMSDGSSMLKRMRPWHAALEGK